MHPLAYLILSYIHTFCRDSKIHTGSGMLAGFILNFFLPDPFVLSQSIWKLWVSDWLRAGRCCKKQILLVFRLKAVKKREGFAYHKPCLSKLRTHEKFKRTLFIQTKTQSANFRGNPLYQATKQQLNENKLGEKLNHLSVFG